MPSTYTSNLGVEKPGAGEQVGTWGTTSNRNMDILDRATNGAVTLSLSGASSTLTTSDGTLSDGQYGALILAGSPSGTHTITIAPSDAQKTYFVVNGSGQAVIFAQGSGATVSVATGSAAAIHCDGIGAGAGVVDLLTSLALSATKITGGTITGITDLAVADGGTGASDAAGARTNLGLGTMATQSAATVAITGGTITGITDLAVADGGTGASDAPAALVNLGLTATAAELNVLDGITATVGELNILDGVTATTAELNILSGVTATASELNILDGVTATAAELNILDGVTATAAELNALAGITSNVQAQLDAKAPLASPTLTGTPAAPTAVTTTNTTQIATTAFVQQEIAAIPAGYTDAEAILAQADATAGAVGTYALLGTGGPDATFGDTVAGSTLYPTGSFKGSSSGTNNSPADNNGDMWAAGQNSVRSGTWRAMGYIRSSGWSTTLWLRIS